ncbi:MAG TPA: succinate--CoA ligase subunit alpha [Nitrososphaeraceae archaeon]|nr:succinate--CoA ligase subunit alpha [Nitrososphaeraceae archaeon]
MTKPNNEYDLLRILVGNPGDVDYARKPVIVQGMTGSFGSVHTRLMRSYGTNIVAGVTPGKGGQVFDGLPIYNSMNDAISAFNAEISIIFVPAQYFLDAVMEALENGIKLIVAIPEHVPIRDSIRVIDYAREREARIIGPNTPGIIVPNTIKIGIMPAEPFTAGKTIVFSRSGTLMYEVAFNLSRAGFGQKICLGIGGDPINGTSLIEALEMVKTSGDDGSIVVVGEIGGDAEEKFVSYLEANRITNRMVAYIAGRTAPKEKKMGHAGAIVYGKYGSAASKYESFDRLNIPVAKNPAEVPSLIKMLINQR